MVELNKQTRKCPKCGEYLERIGDTLFCYKCEWKEKQMQLPKTMRELLE